MYITSKYSGYNRHGEQSASGLFLILLQPNTDSTKYPHMSEVCSECDRTRLAHDEPFAADIQAIADKMHRIWVSIFEARKVEDSEDLRDAVDIILDAKRKVTGCTYFRPASNNYAIRAIVRSVRMRQLGHFMMGSARIGANRITLSGSYGSDGLPTSVSDETYEAGVELPSDLYEAWKNGNGWNSAGSEAPAMRSWALANLETLYGKRTRVA